MSDFEHTVVILDDDQAILQSLEELLKDEGYRVFAYADHENFMQAGQPTCPACLLLDHQLGNGKTGVQVHQEVQEKGWLLPTIFLTAHWNVQSVVAAMRAGADDFLSKPFAPKDLLTAVKNALSRSTDLMEEVKKTKAARSRVGMLTKREYQVISLVMRGLLNKEIADQLNLALVTVKVHRGRAMKKLGAGNAAEMAKIVGLGGLV